MNVKAVTVVARRSRRRQRGERRWRGMMVVAMQKASRSTKRRGRRSQIASSVADVELVPVVHVMVCTG
jgi:hypothetical protein